MEDEKILIQCMYFLIDGLLNMLSQILMHRPLRHPGMPKNAMIAPTPAGGKNFIFDLNLYLCIFFSAEHRAKL